LFFIYAFFVFEANVYKAKLKRKRPQKEQVAFYLYLFPFLFEGKKTQKISGKVLTRLIT